MVEAGGAKGARKKERHKNWKPSAETRRLMTSTWTEIPRAEAEAAEPPDVVIENNMRFHAILGNRILSAAHRALADPKNRLDFQNVEFLIQRGLEHRDRAEKSAVALLPYRKPKLAPAQPEQAEATDSGTVLDASGRDLLAREVAAIFGKAKRRDTTSE